MHGLGGISCSRVRQWASELGEFAERAASAQVREVEPSHDALADRLLVAFMGRTPDADDMRWKAMRRAVKEVSDNAMIRRVLESHPDMDDAVSAGAPEPAAEPAPVAQVDEGYRLALHLRQQQATIADHARIVAELQADRDFCFRQAGDLSRQVNDVFDRAEATEASLAAYRADAERLALQWRHNAQGCSRHESHAAGTWRACARELEAVLPLAGEVAK